MNIRLATLEDAEEIQKVNTEELHYDYPLGKTKEMLELILSLDWQVIYVAEIDGEFAGYVQANKYLGTFGDLLVNIMGLAVSIKFQGHGVGKALMIAAEAWAKEIVAEGVRLNSGEERPEAHAFYEKIGYEKVKFQAKFQKVF
ncbi:GNAT family N-acetyltransferase [Listeria monocytogenes]|nr:GNAT family N-acetyltransferase [Listeria monocytogenes]EID3101685.1 GNAT family N-acetyltransferase [Listeria monocytogenes]